jgi:hypothetical protein
LFHRLKGKLFMKKQYIAFCTDHTGSMRSRIKPAVADYNALVESVKAASIANNVDTIVSHVKIGHRGNGAPHIAIRNSSLTALSTMSVEDYDADAQETRLFDTVVEAIELLKKVPDYEDPDVSFLIMINTDGGNNAGRVRGAEMARMISELQKSDRWTVVFRVPKGREAGELERLGIDPGNIMEWELSSAGLATATTVNTQAMNQFYQGRAAGMKSTRSFYANMRDVTSEEVKAALEDVSTKVMLLPVANSEHEMQIRDFVEKRTGSPLLKGAAFYQLTKSEDKVQASKKICIRDKTNNAIYYGPAARQLLGIPAHSDIRLKPDDLGKFDVFIQSTSVNRKVQAGSQLLYWKDVGVAYKEGPSAR